MKRMLFFAAGLAVALTSCTQSEELAGGNSGNSKVPVAFSTYQAQSTRAGIKTPINSTEDLKAAGFGVFAYHTGADKYDETTKPDFMYNQKLTFADPAWTYSPIKYWPNDYSTADKDGATGTQANNYVSFFAYAPYVANTTGGAATGAVDNTDNANGIIKMRPNTEAGNPWVQYKFASDGQDVDLLWGTTGSNGKWINDDANTNLGINSEVETATAGEYVKVNGDLQKMYSNTTDAKVNFLFKHALAKIGGPDKDGTDAIEGLSIILDPDEFDDNQTTKVTVKSIEITSSAKVPAGDPLEGKYVVGGQFDLKTGKWSYVEDLVQDDQPANTTKIVVNPSDNDDELNSEIADKDGDTYANQPEGVVKDEAKAVYANADAKPVLMIPGTTPSLIVKIDYMVRTEDAQLEKGYTEIEQTISKTVNFGSVA